MAVAERLDRLEADPESLRTSIEEDASRVELLELGAESAARAAWAERREYIAEIVARGLSSEELSAEEVKKLLFILRDLTDPELITLIWRARGGNAADDFYSRHRNVLDGGLRVTKDRRALQKAYLETLKRHDLVIHWSAGNKPVVSPLGNLLLRYVGVAG